MLLSDVLIGDELHEADEEWRLADERTGALDPSQDTVHFSMKQGAVLARLANDL
jgi:hypothetical protein